MNHETLFLCFVFEREMMKERENRYPKAMTKKSSNNHEMLSKTYLNKNLWLNLDKHTTISSEHK